MSVLSIVLRGSPSTSLAKSLSDIVGHGAMEIRRRWLDGTPVLMVEVVGPDQEQGAATFERTLEWADGNGVEAEIHETDGLLPPPGERPEPETREYALNALRMGQDLMANPGPE